METGPQHAPEVIQRQGESGTRERIITESRPGLGQVGAKGALDVELLDGLAHVGRQRANGVEHLSRPSLA